MMDSTKRIVRERDGGLEMKPELSQKAMKALQNYRARNENPFLEMFRMELVGEQNARQTTGGGGTTPVARG